MPIDVTVTLDELHCLRDSDWGQRAEPCAWVAMVTGDLAGVARRVVEVHAPSTRAGAQAVIKSDLRAGDRVPMPPAQSRFTHRFPAGSVGAFAAVIVAVQELDELSVPAAAAGYRVFLKGIGAELGSFLKANWRPPDEAEQEEMSYRVLWKSRAAALGRLDPVDRMRLFVRSLDRGDSPAVAARFAAVADIVACKAFTLRPKDRLAEPAAVPAVRPLGQVAKRQHYEITGCFTADRSGSG